MSRNRKEMEVAQAGCKELTVTLNTSSKLSDIAIPTTRASSQKYGNII